MSRSDSITRLRAADPAANRYPITDPALTTARINATQLSTDADALAAIDFRRAWPRHGARRPSVRGAAALSIAVLALPGAALAASALFSVDDVERGLPDGAQVLNGTDPACTEVEPGTVYDCALKTAPADPARGSGDGKLTWQGAVSLMANRDELVNGGCRSEAADGMAWRCFVGQRAADEGILDARLLGMPIHDECVQGLGPKPDWKPGDPGPAPLGPDGPYVAHDPVMPPAGESDGSAAAGEPAPTGQAPTTGQTTGGTFFCATRGTFGPAVTVRVPDRP
jgi:hypothetical protein